MVGKLSTELEVDRAPNDEAVDDVRLSGDMISIGMADVDPIWDVVDEDELDEDDVDGDAYVVNADDDDVDEDVAGVVDLIWQCEVPATTQLSRVLRKVHQYDSYMLICLVVECNLRSPDKHIFNLGWSPHEGVTTYSCLYEIVSEDITMEEHNVVFDGVGC